jgi:glucose/arabinose dehydrogenase/mono/diheme cytochrome c family protein
MFARFLALFLFISIFSFGCKRAYDPEKAPMLTPEESIADMKIEDGFKVELVAAEPLVESPVAITFDENGRMWVVEMNGYMPNIEGLDEDKPNGRIKILEDKDEDGFYETSNVFLDGLKLPRAIAIVKGGILLAEPPNLYFVENMGDKAGKRTLIDSTYADVGNVEHQPNGLVRGLDNWLYNAKSNQRYRFSHGKWQIEKTETRGQWGIAQDDFGRMYYNNNSTMIQGDAHMPNEIPRNPNHKTLFPDAYGRSLASNRVYPRRDTRGVNRGYQKGTLDADGKLVNVTGACGVTIYRGDQFPANYRGNGFIMEPTAYLMKRLILSDSSAVPVGKFAYQDREFLAALDERFRPVNASTAPDGSLFVVDMHRGVIQHTTYMTPYLRKHIQAHNLAQPVNAGRIYRIRYAANPLGKLPKMRESTSAQLVQYLAHPNGWWRDTAQRLLVERQDPSAVPSLQDLVLHAPDIRTRLHALWALEGLENAPNALSDAFLAQALASSPDLRLQSSAMRLVKNLDALVSLRQPQNSALEWTFASALGHFHAQNWTKTAPILADLALKYGDKPAFTDAIIGGLEAHETDFKRRLLPNTPAAFGTALDKAIEKALKPKVENMVHLSKQDRELYDGGKGAFKTYCASCHGENGEGLLKTAPPLVGSEWVMHSNPDVPTKIILDGLEGKIHVAGKDYATPDVLPAMPALRDNIETNNGTIASILTYIRNSWGNRAAPIHVEEVAKVRAATANRQQSYKAEELR